MIKDLNRMHSMMNNRGATLVISLFVTVILLVLGGVFLLRSINESNTALRERRLSQAFYIAEGGAEFGLSRLYSLINVDMLNTVNATNPQKVARKAKKFTTNGDALGFLILYVKDSGGGAQFTINGTEAEYHEGPISLGQGAYEFDIKVSEKTDPILVATDIWDFPYYFRIESTGNVGDDLGRVLLVGDFTVRVQRDNFAKYALFTDHHGMPSGSTVWFTQKTNFAGPIHTNEKYSFAFNPSGIFDGKVTQHHNQARFFNNGWSFTADADSNPGIDVPVFNAGFDRGVSDIVLASSVQKQDLYDQARGGDGTTGNGIFVANNGTDLTGGIYVRGDATVDMGVDGSNNATYTITQGGSTKIVTVDIPNNTTMIESVGIGSETYQGVPDGVDDLGTIIYVDGSVTSLKGTVQQDTEVTVSCENDIVITDHLVYQDYNPAVGSPGDSGYVPPNATGKTNLMGLVAWGGDVRIGTSAPDNLDVHSVIMARNGVFTVDNYNSGSPRGQLTMLGGAITQFYGAFGLFDGSTGAQVSGYGRNFVYDNRTLVGKSPPYFPSMKTFVAFTNDLSDKISFQQGGF